jgi:glutaminyl-tRNA synthetase
VRLVNPLFLNPTPDVATFTTELNPNSLEVIADAMLEPAIATAGDAPMQFERLGYFRRDPDSTAARPVFNRTVSLRDTFTRTLAEGDKAGA